MVQCLTFLAIMTCFNFKMVSSQVLTLSQVLNKQENSKSACNLQGQHLKAIGLIAKPYLEISPLTRQDFVLFEESRTYDITEKAHGYLVDTIHALASVCNFTYSIHVGLDDSYGNVKWNGTKPTLTGSFQYFNSSEAKNSMQ